MPGHNGGPDPGCLTGATVFLVIIWYRHCPRSSAPFRYDPNDLSLEDDSGNVDSAIKNLNFSKIARESSGAGSGASSGRSASNSANTSSNSGSSSCSAASTTTRMDVSPDWMRDDVAGEESYTAPSLPSGAPCIR